MSGIQAALEEITGRDGPRVHFKILTLSARGEVGLVRREDCW